MRVSSPYAMAASIAALCVAAPAAYYVAQHRGLDVGSGSGGARVATPPQVASSPVPAALSKVEPGAPGEAVADKTASQDGPAKLAESDAGRVDAGRRAEGEARAKAERARDERARQQQVLAPQTSERSSIAGAPPPASLAARPVGRLVDGLVGGQVAVVAPPMRREPYAALQIEQGRDRFEAKDSNPVRQVANEPVSTFSVDVDTASYSFVRRSLNAGRLPPKDAVRVEEMINYFPYDYARPDSAAEPFKASVQVMPSPWKAGNQLVHIGLKGYDIKSAERPRANLVLLVDVSGSMGPEDRLPLVRNAFRMLVETLKPDDTIAIVTYASGSDVRLSATKIADKEKILAAIDSLRAGGSTHGAAGITDAYRIAEMGFDKAAVNRVILATDGDWNVGITSRDDLKGFVERKRQSGVFLSVLGVGMGNHNDALMQALAQNGNGVAAYIDTLGEARKVLVEEASSSLFPIAKDVKIQLEFNPARVAEYRLIGYETRMLRREDFNNDKVDAGDVGSGHAVTAIYEITPVGAARLADDLRYRASPARGDAAAGSGQSRTEAGRDGGKEAEIGFLKLRYKLPKEDASRLATFVVGPEQTRREVAEASSEARFSVAVAAFGQLLKGSPHVGGFTYDDVIALANGAKGDDPFGYRAEFVNLVRLAKSAGVSVAPR